MGRRPRVAPRGRPDRAWPAEHSARYARVAEALTGAGSVVAAIDHRGHGASITDTPGDFGAPGWNGLVGDLVDFGASLKEQYPGLPFFLIAHSMGSFAAQSALLDHSDQYTGVVLSGSTGVSTSSRRA